MQKVVRRIIEQQEVT